MIPFFCLVTQFLWRFMHKTASKQRKCWGKATLITTGLQFVRSRGRLATAGASWLPLERLHTGSGRDSNTSSWQGLWSNLTLSTFFMFRLVSAAPSLLKWMRSWQPWCWLVCPAALWSRVLSRWIRGQVSLLSPVQSYTLTSVRHGSSWQ